MSDHARHDKTPDNQNDGGGDPLLMMTVALGFVLLVILGVMLFS